MEHTSGFARTTGNEHGNIHAQFDVPHAHTGLHEGVFEGKTTAEEETDEIVSPVGLEIVDLLDEYTIPVHTIAWDIRTNVSTWCEFSRFRIASVEHFKQWTWLRVPLAEKQKIIGQGTWYHYQVGLRIARCQASGWTAPLPGLNTLADLAWRRIGQVVYGACNGCHKTFFACTTKQQPVR
jgi:hypothetical protein